jgi:hypothetical protein
MGIPGRPSKDILAEARYGDIWLWWQSPKIAMGGMGRTWVEHGRKGTSLVTFSGLFGYSGSRGNYLGGLQEMSFKP